MPVKSFAKLILLLPLLFIHCKRTGNKSFLDRLDVFTREKVAVEFPKYADWVNTAEYYSIQEFYGKIVLLEFWTYSCINCYQAVFKINELKDKYPELVLIGIHSPKLPISSALE